AGLVEARQRRVGEDVVGLELAEPLAGLDRLRVPSEVVQRQREPLPAVGEIGVEGDGLVISCDRIVQPALRDEVHRLVVEIVLVGHWGWVALWLNGGKPRRPTAGTPPSAARRDTLTPRSLLPTLLRVSRGRAGCPHSRHRRRRRIPVRGLGG